MNGIFTDISLWLVLICMILGAVGQLLRATIGLYKLYMRDSALKKAINWRRFIVSICMGMLIGTVISLIYRIPLSNTDILGIIACAYSGSDWLEGFLSGRSGQIT